MVDILSFTMQDHVTLDTLKNQVNPGCGAQHHFPTGLQNRKVLSCPWPLLLATPSRVTQLSTGGDQLQHELSENLFLTLFRTDL